MTWFLAVLAFLALAVVGVWLPVLWIAAAVILVAMIVYGIGLMRSRGAPLDADR
jgi:hypothetical protein